MSLKEDLQVKFNLTQTEVENEILEIGLDPEIEDFSIEDGEKVLTHFENKYSELNLQPIVDRTAILSERVKDNVVESVAERARDREAMIVEQLSQFVEGQIDATVIKAFDTGQVVEIYEQKSVEMVRSRKKPFKLLAQLKQQTAKTRLLSGESYQPSLPSSEDSSEI